MYKILKYNIMCKRTSGGKWFKIIKSWKVWFLAWSWTTNKNFNNEDGAKGKAISKENMMRKVVELRRRRTRGEKGGGREERRKRKDTEGK